MNSVFAMARLALPIAAVLALGVGRPAGPASGAAAMARAAGVPAAAAAVQPSSTIAAHLSGLRTADGGRYALTFSQPPEEALPGLRARVRLPAGSDLVQALETPGRTQLVRAGDGLLEWSAGDVLPGETPPAFVFVLASQAADEVSAELLWDGGEAIAGVTASTVEITAGEGQADLIAGRFVPAGDTGVLVAPVDGASAGSTITVRRLGPEANPPDGTGALWWCALVEVEGAPEGALVNLLLPARQPLPPNSEIRLFARTTDGWQVQEQIGRVTADGQFIAVTTGNGSTAAGTATANQPQPAALTANLSAAQIGAPPISDLALTKTALSPGTQVSAGSTLTMQTTVKQNGNATSPAAATLVFTLPATLSFERAIASGSGVSCNQTGADVVCTLPPLTLSQSRDVRLNLLAGSVTAPINVCVTAAVNVNEAITTNNTDSGCGTVTPAPPVDRSLSVVHTSSGPYRAGSTIAYQLTVKVEQNSSTGPFSVMTVLSAGHGDVTAVGQGWSCAVASSLVTCTRSDALASPNSYPPITIVGKVTPCSSALSITALLSVGDANSSNNTSNLSAPASCPNLALSFTQSDDIVGLGDRIDYSVVITNQGAGPTGGQMTLKIELPGPATLGIWDILSDNPPGWTCVFSGGPQTTGPIPNTYTCTSTETIAAGGSRTLTISARHRRNEGILAAIGGCVTPGIEAFTGPQITRMLLIGGGISGGRTATKDTRAGNCFLR